MMTDGFHSTAINEDLNIIASNKREGDVSDVDLIVKKSRTSCLEVERQEKPKNLDCCGPQKIKLVLVEEKCENDKNLQARLSTERVDDNRSITQNNSCDKNCLLVPACHLPCIIEADAAEDKGSRHTMEDAWVVLPEASLEFPGKLRLRESINWRICGLMAMWEINRLFSLSCILLRVNNIKGCGHFAVYDGHRGRLAAEYAQKHLHANVLSAGLPRELMDVKAAKKAILDGFHRTDESLLQESAKGGWQDGATAVCIWVLGQKVFVANVGDAKAVVARLNNSDGLQNHLNGASSLKAIVLTREHKAIYPQERSRILKVGGSVSSDGRLLGRLEVSRAFGDRQFKKVGVIATPDVHSFDLTEREQFIILGCDGLWGVFGPSDAVDFVHKLLKEGLSVTAVSRRLVREAVRERRCKDNCTAVVIVFKHK